MPHREAAPFNRAKKFFFHLIATATESRLSKQERKIETAYGGKMFKSRASKIAMLAMILLTFLFSVKSMRAHQTYEMRMTIPFDFYLGEKLLPAGEYEVFAWNNVVRIHNPAASLTAGIQTQALKKDSGEIAVPEVIFTRYGEEYFLSEIWWGRGTSVGNTPMFTGHQVELAKTFSPTRIVARAGR